MKLATADDFRAYHDATVAGGIRGAVLGTGLAVPSYLILKRRSQAYRNLPTPLKALGAVMIMVPCISISAEKAGEAFTRSQYSGVAKRELDREAQEEADRWEQMSFVQKMGDWAGRRKYALIGVGWVGSLGAAWAITARNPYQTTSQKVVQARMWAQGLTVGLLIASALATGFNTETTEEPRAMHEDHTWRAILENDPNLSAEEKRRLADIRSAATAAKQTAGQA
ncbi:hypothetical protein IAU60_000121 [Kwoniella sp. DSM 27419]